MDNRARGGMLGSMIGIRPILTPLVALMLVLAVFAGSLGQGAMIHAAPQADGAHAHHAMHDMPGMAQDVQGGTGGDMRTSQAECAMAACCFSEMLETRADHACVAMSARYAAMPAHSAQQPAPERAKKPPRRT